MLRWSYDEVDRGRDGQHVFVNINIKYKI
jgi:hypothetical protein